MFKKPFPLILQHDSMECGIACLSMICKYHGREYSTRYLSRLCFATTEGVSLLGITEAAKALGLKTVAARVSVDELRELPLPCILHWNQQHFVVLYRIGKGGRKYDVADPGKGLVTYQREEFQKHWISTADGGEEKGIAMFLEPTEAFQEHQPDMGGGEKRSFGFLLGYYPPLGGRLLIAGRDIARYDLKWWRRQCGVVMQDGVIFSESIARNIAVDDGEIDLARLEEAARVACIHDYVMKLPLKYNTKIGRDGVGLSQGQKQRILIARAVYKHPDFIFLDEATNSLDAKNERMIVENLEKFYQDRTVVVVAHRLSTVKNASQIVVVDEGKIVETGTHEELIARKGAYYNLVKNQLELGT